MQNSLKIFITNTQTDSLTATWKHKQAEVLDNSTQTSILMN